MQESRKVVSVELPVYISDRVRDHFIQSQSENPGVLVTLHQDESVRMHNSDIFQGCDDIIIPDYHCKVQMILLYTQFGVFDQLCSKGY